MHTLKFPEAFIKRMKIQLGDEAEDFFKSLKEEPAVSLRVNPAKNTGEYENEENIPWCKFGKYLNKKPEFVFDPIIHAGGYFVQDASSMFFHKAINFSKDIRVLELSASKGDNSTLLLSLMTENSILFSNRLPGGKASILAENIIKWGNANVIVSSNYSSAFKNFAAYFDVILIDAPSSLEGFFRKKTRTIEKWATNKAFQFSVNQKNILDDAISLLKKDGILIYTTQTYSLEENEQIMQWFYKKYESILEPFKINIPEKWNIVQQIIKHFNNCNQIAYKFYPHKLKGEGRFLSVFRYKGNVKSEIQLDKKNTDILKNLSKEENDKVFKFVSTAKNYQAKKIDEKVYLLPSKYISEIQLAYDKLNVLKAGIFVGTFNKKSNDFIPSHELALSTLVNKKCNSIEISKNDALRFIKKEAISYDTNEIAWILVKHKGLVLGWVKRTGNKFNNFYPKEWKIKKALNL